MYKYQMTTENRQLHAAQINSDSASTDPSKTLCRYFMNGACRQGSRCQFSHDRSDRPSNVCRYYLLGSCSYGAHCRYDHVKPKNRPEENAKRAIQLPADSLSSRLPSSSTSSISNPEPVNSIGNKERNGILAEDSDQELGFVSLKGMASKSACVNSSKLRADAKEFVPSGTVVNNGLSPASYAHAVSGGAAVTGDTIDYSSYSADVLCPYFIMGECVQGDACPHIHGDVCELCGRPVLHPTDPVQNAEHRQNCMAHHEREMEFAFAVAQGEGKQCGICMEVVMEKTNLTSRRFGILPGCKHCFCVDCIRKWRRAEQFENKVIRACPECRTRSDFVIPSTIWVEADDEKVALLDAYQSSMKQKTCKYFQDGQTECPFGNKCFYRHVKPDGTEVEGEDPRAIRRRQERLERARTGAGPSADIVVLWDFFEGQEWYRNGQRFSESGDEEDDWFFEFTLDRALDALRLDSDSDPFDY